MTISSWDCYTLFFLHLYQSCSPWFTPNFRFHSISWEQIDIFPPNFIYALILTSSSLALLHIIFQKFIPELWSLDYAKISFVLNSLKLNRQSFTNFIYALILATIYSLGLLHFIFLLLCQSYGPWFTPKFCFYSIIWEQVDRILPNFKYAFILTITSLLQSFDPLLVSEVIPDQYL